MPTLHRGFLALAAVLALAVSADAQRARPAGWTDATHGSNAAPDYERLFALDRVHEIRITIPPDQFAAMQEDLKTVGRIPGGFGPGGGGPGAGPGGGFDFQQMIEAGAAACDGRAAADPCTAAGVAGQCGTMPGPGNGALVCLPPGFGGRGGIQLTSRDPIYVPVTVEYDGHSWTNVGMRFKGNLSLVATVNSGNGKIPFRLNFDRFEDQAPETRNQRFYGFKEMTFSSNFGDDSQIRELLASEVFRDRGVPAPRAAFYRVVVDTGAGPEYWGLYTMVEDPDDGAMLQSQFGSRSGNLYKPDGPGSDWTTFDPAGFEKKNNNARPDFSDVQAAVAALHAPVGPAEAWRAGLERVFDVDHFLRWLAVNTAIGNWDAYGAMAHNYYLYADPASGGRLRWIPWDNNFAFGAAPGAALGRGGPGAGGQGGPGFGGGPGGRGGFPPARGGGPGGRGPGGGRGFPSPGGNGDVLHATVGPEWPLIQKLLADPVYQARYRAELQRAIAGLMAPDALAQRARALQAMIAPSVVGPQGERPTHTTISSAEAFQDSLDGPNGVITFVTQRVRAITTALAAPAAP